MKIAVTTASGQLGRSILEALIKEIGKENLIGIARTPEKASDLGIEIRKGNYTSREDFDKALVGVDTVMLVSGMDHPDKRIGQHRNVIGAARDAGVRKIVYSSIVGKEGSSTFDAIVSSNRQTEQDIRESGMDWVIGRNGLYMEPDVEYLDTYVKEGRIANCAGEGLCSYTTRGELAFAYARMLLNNDRNGQIYNLAGEAISQERLCQLMNKTFGTDLVYEAVSPEAYLEVQQRTNGEFLGRVIAGIYTKILNGEFHIDSHYREAAGREHISWEAYFAGLVKT
jgi:NAD(P)H dehydrogenase (quinone)